jgi:quinol monooxygenase YgiN
MPQVAVIAKIRSAPGKRAELAKEFGTALSEVENEAGTLTYILHEDQKDEDLLWFYETYSDQDALKAHGSSEWMRRSGRSSGRSWAAVPSFTFLNPSAARGSDAELPDPSFCPRASSPSHGSAWRRISTGSSPRHRQLAAGDRRDLAEAARARGCDAADTRRSSPRCAAATSCA